MPLDHPCLKAALSVIDSKIDHWESIIPTTDSEDSKCKAIVQALNQVRVQLIFASESLTNFWENSDAP